MSGGSDRICLGVFAVSTGISLIIATRGGRNDAYTAFLVFMIGLFQLFEYGVWRDLQCNPGKSNNRASRGAYILIWAMPALLGLVGFLFADDVIADPAGRWLLLGSGFAFTALLAGLIPILYTDNSNWCTTHGNLWQPIWWFQHGTSPLTPNLIWTAGVLVPTLMVDPFGLGAGTLALGTGSYMMGRWADKLDTGEWLSITSLMANSIAVWALLLPGLRFLVWGKQL